LQKEPCRSLVGRQVPVARIGGDGVLSPNLGATSTHFLKNLEMPYIFVVSNFFKYKNEKKPEAPRGREEY